MPYSAASNVTRNLIIGFIAGAVAVPLGHQIMVLILHAVGLTANTPYRLLPLVKPFGIYAIFNLMFWGGVWGMVWALIADRLPQVLPLLALGFLFGMIGPVVVSWFIISPIKGRPIASGWVPRAMLASLLINGAWGLVTAFAYDWMRRLAGASSARTA